MLTVKFLWWVVVGGIGFAQSFLFQLPVWLNDNNINNNNNTVVSGSVNWTVIDQKKLIHSFLTTPPFSVYQTVRLCQGVFTSRAVFGVSTVQDPGSRDTDINIWRSEGHWGGRLLSTTPGPQCMTTTSKEQKICETRLGRLRGEDPTWTWTYFEHVKHKMI